MVFVGDKKYACETCIKGHRSSSCKHTDRPLYEIKKKGRPVTQCEHCRELRKTKQVHVKCMCGSKDREDGEAAASSSKKGIVKLSTSAAFPSGIPEALEASVAFHLGSDGSDSDHSGHGSSGLCSCKDGAACECCTPRVSRGQHLSKDRDRRGSRGSVDSNKSPPSADLEPQITQPAGLVVTAHSGDYRPVLPRPSPQRQPSPPKAAHNPDSPAPKASLFRHQTHAQMFYSPYGRAYEFTHSTDYVPESSTSHFQQALSGANSPYPDGVSDSMPPWFPALSVSPSGGSTIPTSLCGCGSSCACAGCAVHRGPNADPTSPCVNPGACMGCLDCAMFSLPSSISPDSSQAQQEASQLQSIDDWIRQVSSMLGSTSGQLDASFPAMAVQAGPGSAGADMRFDPSLLQTYALWNELQNGQLQSQAAQRAPEECCGGRCKCPAGACSCTADCCGCCQGCDCAECQHEENPHQLLTFAVSGERGSCCGGAHHHHMQDQNQSAASGSGLWDGQSLTVPRTSLSRASSQSSQSSSHHSHTSTPGSVPEGAAGQSEDVRALRASLGMMNTDMNMDVDMHVPTQAHASLPSPIPMRSIGLDHRTSASPVEYGMGLAGRMF